MDNTNASGVAVPQTLMDLMRSPQYTLETRALLLGDIRRFKQGTITPNYWTFRFGGDEIVVDDRTLDVISAALTRSAGTKVRLDARTDRNATMEEVLTVHGTAREALFREALGYLAECDETVLPNQARKDLSDLGSAVAEAARKAGIYNGEVALTMPHLLQLLQDMAGQGSVVVTKNADGVIVLVSRQDDEGRILSVIAEPGLSPSGAQEGS